MATRIARAPPSNTSSDDDNRVRNRGERTESVTQARPSQMPCVSISFTARLCRSDASIDSIEPHQNRTRDDTEQSKSTPAARDRIPTSVANNKQFTHSLVIRHKLQLCRARRRFHPDSRVRQLRLIC